MSMLKRIQSLFRNILQREKADELLDEELASCIQILAQQKIDNGMAPDEALRLARIEIGGVEYVKQRVWEARAGFLIHGVILDLRHGLRVLGKHPTFTAVAVVSLALAIGATTATYSTADWLLNRSPEGVAQPERIVTMRSTDQDHPQLGNVTFTFTQYENLRRMQDVFVDVAAYMKWLGVASSEERADQTVLEFVTGNYFPMLGVRPALGRTILPEDDVEGGPPVALLSYDFWQRQFGGDPGVLKRTIRLNGTVGRVIGVLPPEFVGYDLDWSSPTSVWVPMQAVGPLVSRGFLRSRQTMAALIGRMRPGIDVDQVRQRAQSWVPVIAEGSEIAGRFRMTTIVVSPGNEARIGRREEAQTFFGTLQVVCVLILLAGCFSIANFLLGQAVSRRAEMALRLALGASRMRLIRQLMMEAFLIGVSACAVGLAIGIGLARALAMLTPVYLDLPPTWDALTTEAAIDRTMVVHAIAIGFVSTMIFGLLPAVLASFRNPMQDLKDPKPHWTWCGVRLTSRQAILVPQVALSVVLAVVASLYTLSFARAAGVRSEYRDEDSVLLAKIVPPTSMSRGSGAAFYRELLARLETMPSVDSATIGFYPPYFLTRAHSVVPGREMAEVEAASNFVAPGWFRTHGIRMVSGREFTDTENDTRNGLIVNEVLAERRLGSLSRGRMSSVSSSVSLERIGAVRYWVSALHAHGSPFPGIKAPYGSGYGQKDHRWPSFHRCET